MYTSTCRTTVTVWTGSRVSCRVSFSERFWRIQSFSDRSLVRRSEASLHLVVKLRGYDRPSPLSDGSTVGDNMSIFAATSERSWAERRMQ